MLRRLALDRRTLLRGAGTAFTLPLLDAMVPAATAASKTAAAPGRLKRLAFTYVPMGFNPARWTPESEGKLGALPFALEPLEGVKENLTVVSGTELRNAYPGSHATSNSTFLSASRAKRTESADYRNGTTVDQIAAGVIGGRTQLPSLELAMDSLTNIGQCDNGYACVYQNNLAWSSPTTPLPSEANPRVVFETLFGDGGSPEERRQVLARRGSLLDAVADEMRRLKGRLGPADRDKVDEYVESIRDVERRVERAEAGIDENPLPDLDRPLGAPASYADHAKLMFDMQRLAFQGDITRVVSFQLAREASTRSYPEVGVPESHHPTTHHGHDPEKLEKVAKINRFHVSLFAEFVASLAATPEGDGTLLEHSALLYGSGMGDPDKHDHTDLPILVAGGKSGAAGGRHVVFPKHTPLANVHLSLLQGVGVEVDAFADSEGTADEIFEPVTL
ncbi:MAG: DUF1552 domain-containing protein [Planctomycetota bacterium]